MCLQIPISIHLWLPFLLSEGASLPCWASRYTPEGYTGAFLLYQSAHPFCVRALDLRHYSFLRLLASSVSPLGKVSFCLLHPITCGPLLACQCPASKYSVLVSSPTAHLQASCLLFGSPTPKYTSVTPKEGDGLGAEFRVTSGHFCPLPGIRISIRKLPTC